MKWFEVDKAGLGKLLARRGKQFIIYELLQNAWDEASTEVRVKLESLGRNVMLTVRDNSPDGFADLSHAFTLFAESRKTTDAEKRGRFNLGEKLVLALCDQAEIASTRGTVKFDGDGRHTSRKRTAGGSVFTGWLRLTGGELDACRTAVRQVIPPAGVETWFNDERLERPDLRAVIDGTPLETEISDAEGRLRPTTRQTRVEIYQPADGTAGVLYEMGIPVVETGDRWHVNIGQKVPLNMDRDNVRPAYLSRVRAVVAERMMEELTSEDATSLWVKDAVTKHGHEMSDALVNDLAKLRFGEKRVAYDPSDPEANALAASRGYTVVHGGHLSGPEWGAMRRTGAIPPAGQVTPSPKPFHADGRPLKLLPAEKRTVPIEWFVAYADRVGRALMGVSVSTTLACDIGWNFAGAYGKGGALTINVARMGYKWFEGDLARINEFLIHEFGHEYSGNHLAEEYHDALCRLGGKLSQLALDEPELFDRAE